MPEPYHVVYRACDAVESVHAKPRPFGLEKRELVKLCFLSLHRSIRPFPHDVTVIGDRLSDDLSAFFSGLGVKLLNHEEALGNAGSLGASIEIALSLPDDTWVYLCEDDYLHWPDAFAAIDELVRERETVLSYAPKPRWLRLLAHRLERKPLFISPVDDPYWYRPKKRRPGLMFVSGRSHWRQARSTCFTLLAQARTLRRYEQTLRSVAANVDDRSLSRALYGGLVFGRRGLLVAPVPGLATHMTEGTMTPRRDWAELVRELRAELAAAQRARGSSA